MLHDNTRSNKNRAVYEGPFKVLERIRGGSYRLLDHDHTLHPRAVAPSQLKIVSVNPSHDPVSLVVDSILAHRGPRSKRQYLVRWKHLPESDNSWEPAENFDSDQILADYWDNLQDPNSISGGGDLVPPQTIGNSRRPRRSRLRSIPPVKDTSSCQSGRPHPNTRRWSRGLQRIF